MAEAPAPTGGGGSIDGGLIVFIIIILLLLWLRNGGWEKFREHPVNFGWKSASTTAAFPFAPNIGSLAPHVSTPNSPQGPAGPDPYN
jgi:hypothetical protein